MEIKGIEFRNNQLAVMDPKGKIVTCPERPSIRINRSGRAKPYYNEETNSFVCGSDRAQTALREMLALTLVVSRTEFPWFICEDEFLSDEVSETVAEWLRIRNAFGLPAVAQAA